MPKGNLPLNSNNLKRNELKKIVVQEKTTTTFLKTKKKGEEAFQSKETVEEAINKNIPEGERRGERKGQRTAGFCDRPRNGLIRLTGWKPSSLGLGGNPAPMLKLLFSVPISHDGPIVATT